MFMGEHKHPQACWTVTGMEHAHGVVREKCRESPDTVCRCSVNK